MAAASPAFAQNDAQNQAPANQGEQAATQQQSNEGDIVVTAQFREQRLQDTPLAITAVNAEMLRARSQQDITQVANQAPNVTLTPQGASFGPSLIASIRGIGQTDFNPAFEPGVGIYVDDVYYATLTGSVVDLLDIERVEILRGPQGTLAGRNSIGGSVRVFSRTPQGDGSGRIDATYGSRNRVGIRGSYDFSIADHLYARISGVYRRQDGYVDRLDFGCVNPPGSALNPNPSPTTGQPAVPATRPPGHCLLGRDGSVGYAAVRAMVRYAPSDAVDIVASADYTRDQRTAAPEVLFDTSPPSSQAITGYEYSDRFICGRYCNFASYINNANPTPPAPNPPLRETRAEDQVDYSGWNLSLTGNFRLADHINLTSITAYREYDALFNADDDLSPSFNGLGQNDVSFWFFSQELRLSGQIGNTFNWTVGGFYSKQRSVYYSLQDIRYIGLSFQFFENDPVRVNSKAVFANVSWEPLPGLTFNGGVRYTDEFKNYTFLRRNLDGTPGGAPFSSPAWLVAAVDGVSATFDGPQSTRFDYRASVDYRFSPQLLAYASISTGFKGGGISPRPFNASQVISFGPEVVTSYEGGLKLDLFDNRLRLNLAGFISDYADIQTPLQVCPSGPPPCGAWANAGDGQYKGFEIEMTARPVTGLLIDASLSLLDFHYTSINAAAGGPLLPGGPQLDNPSPSPRWKWSAGIQYEMPLGGGAGTITPRFDIAYQSRSFIGRGPVGPDPDGAGPLTGVPGTQLFIGGHTAANARLTYRSEDRNWEAALEVTNLFDNYYYLTSFNLAPVGAGFWKVQPSRPREWALTITRRF